jgi:hypothetical protein
VIRRVVTGRDLNGRSHIVSDTTMPPRLGAVDLWSSETSVNGTPPFYPPAGGVIFRLIEFPPLPAGTSPEVLKTAAEAFFADAGALDCLVDTSRDPWMHETRQTTQSSFQDSWTCYLMTDRSCAWVSAMWSFSGKPIMPGITRVLNRQGY